MSNPLKAEDTRGHTPQSSDADSSNFFQDPSDWLDHHQAVKAGLEAAIAISGLYLLHEGPMTSVKVIPAVEGEAVAMARESGFLRNFFGIAKDAPVIPSGATLDASVTSKWFGLGKDITYDMRTLKLPEVNPIPRFAVDPAVDSIVRPFGTVRSTLDPTLGANGKLIDFTKWRPPNDFAFLKNGPPI